MAPNGLKKAIEHLGSNMKPAYPMMAVAIANGIFKPITTLTDKKQSPETKKYTAIREVLTEVVAVPTYLASNLIAEKGAEALYKNNPEKLAIAKGNIGFMGVCAPLISRPLIGPVLNLRGVNKEKDNKPKEIAKA